MYRWQQRFQQLDRLHLALCNEFRQSCCIKGNILTEPQFSNSVVEGSQKLQSAIIFGMIRKCEVGK
jgi:hypothetical protein